MKKSAFVVSLVLVAGLSYGDQSAAQPTTQTMAAKPAEKAATVAKEKIHEVAAEIVSVDATTKTITLKGEKENKTVSVDDKALASIKDLKAGQKVTLLCRDNEKGEHLSVAGVKAEAKAPAAPVNK